MKSAHTIALLIFGLLTATQAAEKPNILFILADDLGYGDVQCFNPEHGRIATPQMDQLAREGMMFTDAHASSSVCTPSRYGILTGRYNWRSKLQKEVLMGFDPPLITPDTLTIAGLLQKEGYHTACIGKWHLGLGFPTQDGQAIRTEGLTNIDWTQPISGGPTALGFDYFYGITASLNIAPYIYMENDHFVGECTVIKGFNRKGPAQADFEAIDTLPHLSQKVIEFIKQQSPDTPFFAYIPLTSPHTPLVPTKEWQGKSPLGPYGDFVMQTDATIGKLLDTLDAKGMRENTIVIITSDNGCSKWCNIQKLIDQGHLPSAQYRGSKGDLWDGGHRVPFIIRWPAKVKAGAHCDTPICLTDLMATFAEITGTPLPETEAEDSVSFLPALLGQPLQSSRKGIVHHSFSGHFAYREGPWKLLLAKASGGWSSPTEAEAPIGAPIAQLYHMGNDPGETTNLYTKYPEIAERLLHELQIDVDRGRSTPGPTQTNDVPTIQLWKTAP